MSLGSRALALSLVAILAGVAIHQRNLRLRHAYEARTLVEERARLENEISWLSARIESLVNPVSLLPRAKRLGVVPEGPVGRTVAAKPAEPATEVAGR